VLGVIDDRGAPLRLRLGTVNRIAVVGSSVVACGIGGYNVTDSTGGHVCD
jgi:hypothetical protein